MEDKIKKYIQMLMDLPKSIHRKQTDILNISEEALEYEEKIKEIEGDLKIDISNETDPNGKKAFTNSETREIEFRSRASENQTLVDLKNKLATTKRLSQGLRLDVEMEQNTQRNIRSILSVLEKETL